MKDNGLFVGFDTSNYTTSVAVADNEGRVLANLKTPLTVKAGERGLRQSDAVFAHVKNLPALTAALPPILAGGEVRAVGVSARPRDAENSYMPCFLAGVAAAQAFAAAAGVPLYENSHQNGHLMAALYSAHAAELPAAPFGAFHVSGGTTEMLFVTPRKSDFAVSLAGGSADLHAGQAVDRVGVMLGLSFPCGPALEALAAQNKRKVPRPRVCVSGGECHFSGLENMAADLWRETGDAPLVAAFTLRFIAQTLIGMARYLRAAHPDLPLLFAGGVMSNRLIAAELRAALGEGLFFAEPAFSADNAAGAALLARAAYRAAQEF